ncbi:TIGR02302 family protein [Lentibacter algarum]|uniref:TIGR02302 family protein n=1 Tax=Lentibacter algarum TaxID=576131 RepID=UPI001C088CFA|nr:TIGR02302 family protein [Lentibacter algarum]MBU2983575.1 TIGR02302 family protein [Lentibacter algarum]
MAEQTPEPERIDLRSQIRLTLWGLWAERICTAFWVLASVAAATLAFIFLGLHEVLPLEIVWSAFVLAALGGLYGLWFAVRRFKAPSKLEALDRIDASLPGQPIRAVRDKQAVGVDNPNSKALWSEYQRRMFLRIRAARSIPPNVKLAGADPFGLRFVAALGLVVSLLFGSVWKLGTVHEVGVPVAGAAQASGPSWEGWVEPPLYTGLPAMYLADVDADRLELPAGSDVTLRLYGDFGAVTVSETVSGRLGAVSASAEEQNFRVEQSGELKISGGAGERAWQITVVADIAPMIEATGPAEATASGAFTLPFEAIDDYGIESGLAVIELDLAAISRRFGLEIDPESTEAIEVPVPLPVAGSRLDFEETLVEDFSKHAWANLPVRLTLSAKDEAGNEGRSQAFELDLAARHFFNPEAAAVIELRRDLLWNRGNAPRVAQLLRAISHSPEGLFDSETDYLRLRTILRGLEAQIAIGGLSDEARDELTEAMWDLALNLEEGNLADALEKMRDAQEKLSEAMRNGASEDEIARLMDELREATRDYMQQLAQRQQQEGEEGEQGEPQGESMELSQQDLQDMMDRIQELMEQGRMAEAEQALQEFQEMMENMRVTQSQEGSGQNEGQQAMEGLSETLREQQGLSDQAFRDLQEQFNPNARAGESGQNEGRNGGQGRGEEHEGQGTGEGQGEGREGSQGSERAEGQKGEGGEQGESGEQGAGADTRSLAERQQDLRKRLAEQRGNMPNLPGEAGEAMRDALKGAGEAMERAEEALRQNQHAEALDSQAEAMEKLREGMDNLGEAMAQASQGEDGQEGQSGQQAGRNNDDPLGRNRRGFSGSDDAMIGDEDVYRRARELLDEIRKRSGEAERSDTERSYLKRLLERFSN